MEQEYGEMETDSITRILDEALLRVLLSDLSI